MAIVRYTEDELDKMTGLTDWEYLRNMTDDEIDYSDIPPTTDEMFARATRGGASLEMPKRVMVYVSPSLLESFQRATGKSWRSRLSDGANACLRKKVTTA